MRGIWTIPRASGIGMVAGVASVLLWVAYVELQDPVRLPYLAALAVTAFCGISILLLTAIDMLFHRQRGKRIRPVRGFDIALGLLLAVPAMATIGSLTGG